MRDYESMRPALSALSRAFAKYERINKTAHDFGTGEKLHPAEIHCISAIASLGQAGVTELAKHAGVTKGAMSQLLARLDAKALIHREPDPKNRSRSLISLTESGRLADQGHSRFHMEHDREFMEFIAALNGDEYCLFERICRHMDRWMDAYMK